MHVPEGVSFQGLGYRLAAGEEIPEALLAQLPEGHPLKPRQAQPEPRARKAAEGR